MKQTIQANKVVYWSPSPVRQQLFFWMRSATKQISELNASVFHFESSKENDERVRSTTYNPHGGMPCDVGKPCLINEDYNSSCHVDTAHHLSARSLFSTTHELWDMWIVRDRIITALTDYQKHFSSRLNNAICRVNWPSSNDLVFI